jgi:hypothetical protein
MQEEYKNLRQLLLPVTNFQDMLKNDLDGQTAKQKESSKSNNEL